MPDNSELYKNADLTHEFHDKYRTTGIALCLSLAAVASAEGWWFYGLLKDVKNTCNLLQILLYFMVIISAVCLFASSFILQYRHYDGMKHMAQSFFHAYKFIESDKKDETSQKKRDDEWVIANNYFTKADKVIIWLKTLTIANFSSAIFYLILYQPNPIK